MKNKSREDYQAELIFQYCGGYMLGQTKLTKRREKEMIKEIKFMIETD